MYGIIANIPIQDMQDSVTAEQLPIAAACETHSSTCSTSAWSTFSPLRFCLWCTVSPNDDNDKLGQLPKQYFSKSSHTQGRAGGQSPVKTLSQHNLLTSPCSLALPHTPFTLPLSLLTRLQYALSLMAPWGSTSLCYCKKQPITLIKINMG